MPEPPRITVLRLPVTSQAKPTRGAKFRLSPLRGVTIPLFNRSEGSKTLTSLSYLKPRFSVRRFEIFQSSCIHNPKAFVGMLTLKLPKPCTKVVASGLIAARFQVDGSFQVGKIAEKFDGSDENDVTVPR